MPRMRNKAEIRKIHLLPFEIFVDLNKLLPSIRIVFFFTHTTENSLQFHTAIYEMLGKSDFWSF